MLILYKSKCCHYATKLEKKIPYPMQIVSYCFTCNKVSPFMLSGEAKKK